MSGPTNAVMGDFDEPTNVPVSQVDEDVLAEEEKLAKYSKTAEFKRLKEFLESRITYFEQYLPDGTPIAKLNDVNAETVAAHWRAANVIIGELKYILATYENAGEAVDSARRQD